MVYVARTLALFLLTAAAIAGSDSQRDKLDRAFDKIPFDQWLAEHGSTHFRWKVRVSPADLSFHQRLMALIYVTLDGRELETRRKHGSFVFLVQITDSAGVRYQDHTIIELDKFDKNIRTMNVEIAHRAFLMPGAYRLAVAAFDLETGEHDTIRSEFRVPPPESGFLLDAWRGLPAVEFIGKPESSESWYLPAIEGRLHWAPSLPTPARLNILLNIAPSVTPSGSPGTPSSGLPVLLPLLKTLWQSGTPGLSENVNVLDLSRRRSVYRQSSEQDLDWPRLQSSFREADTASIDVNSLSGRHQDAQFFVSQVRQTLRNQEKGSVLVVLSTPVSFQSGEDLQPISLEALPASCVVYIRYQAQPELQRFSSEAEGRRLRRRLGMDPLFHNEHSFGVIDQLAATLKPLHPKIFDLDTPEQAAKILQDIRKMLVSSCQGAAD